MSDKEPDLPKLPEIPQIPDLPVAPPTPTEHVRSDRVEAQPQPTHLNPEHGSESTSSILDEAGISAEEQEKMLPLARKAMEYAVTQAKEAEENHTSRKREHSKKKKKQSGWVGGLFIAVIAIIIVVAECGGAFMELVDVLL